MYPQFFFQIPNFGKLSKNDFLLKNFLTLQKKKPWNDYFLIGSNLTFIHGNLNTKSFIIASSWDFLTFYPHCLPRRISFHHISVRNTIDYRTHSPKFFFVPSAAEEKVCLCLPNMNFHQPPYRHLGLPRTCWRKTRKRKNWIRVFFL